jgi:hypothetical protein
LTVVSASTGGLLPDGGPASVPDPDPASVPGLTREAVSAYRVS